MHDLYTKLDQMGNAIEEGKELPSAFDLRSVAQRVAVMALEVHTGKLLLKCLHLAAAVTEYANELDGTANDDK